MGGVITFFKSVKEFFDSVLFIVKKVAQLALQFFRDPFGTIMKLFTLLLGLVLAAFLMVWYTLLTPLVPVGAFVAGNVAAIVRATLTSVAYGALWTLYGGVALLVFVLDFFTGGYAFRLFLCEAEPDEWALRGNYAAGNRCTRGMACQRPCADRYRPVLAGMVCARTAGYEPAFCPKQHVYRRYVGGSDPAYAAHLGTTDAEDAPGAVFDDTVQPPASFAVMNKKAREAWLRQRYRDRKRFLSACMKPTSADPLVRNLCSNAPLLFPADSVPQVAQACRQMYCDYAYEPRQGTRPAGVRPRQPHERAGFCGKASAVLAGAHAKTAGRGASSTTQLQRIALQSMATVVLLMVLMSAQRVVAGQLFVPDTAILPQVTTTA